MAMYRPLLDISAHICGVGLDTGPYRTYLLISVLEEYVQTPTKHVCQDLLWSGEEPAPIGNICQDLSWYRYVSPKLS